MGHADVVLPAPAVGLAVGGTYVEREPIQRPSADGTGNFRVACKFSHMNFDDPIVHPGQPGTAHLHTYFGNVAANASSTGTSLLAAGNSTCDGGILNRSSYWIPTMMNAAGQPVAPAENTVYYKSGYQGVTPAQIAAEFPVGLQLIAGNAAATSPDPNRQVNWMCNADQNRMGTIPDCPAGGTLRAEVQFPQCWNGRDLSSPDHVSHLAYGQLGSGCPASHPVALSAITFGVDWIVPAGGTSGWHLSSDASPSARGASLHGDVITAWDPATARTWLAYCVRVNADCHIGWLTDNDRLIRGTR